METGDQEDMKRNIDSLSYTCFSWIHRFSEKAVQAVALSVGLLAYVPLLYANMQVGVFSFLQ